MDGTAEFLAFLFRNSVNFSEQISAGVYEPDCPIISDVFRQKHDSYDSASKK